MIRTADITVVTGSVGARADQARRIATDAGGTLDGDDRTAGEHPSATLVLRIPPARLDDVLTQLSALGKEQTRHSSSRDVTTQVADVDSRVRSAVDAIAQLQGLYSKATRVADVIAIEGELSQREADLESLQAQQRALAGQVSLATLTLYLVPAPVTASTTDAPRIQRWAVAWLACVHPYPRRAGHRARRRTAVPDHRGGDRRIVGASASAPPCLEPRAVGTGTQQLSACAASSIALFSSGAPIVTRTPTPANARTITLRSSHAAAHAGGARHRAAARRSSPRAGGPRSRSQQCSRTRVRSATISATRASSCSSACRLERGERSLLRDRGHRERHLRLAHRGVTAGSAAIAYPDPQAGEAVCLGERPQHDQVRMLVQQASTRQAPPDRGRTRDRPRPARPRRRPAPRAGTSAARRGAPRCRSGCSGCTRTPDASCP